MELNTLEITEQPEGLRFTSIRDLVNRTLNKDFGANATPGGVSSGFKELDRTLGGFQKGQLYTIAVKPGMGKTAFLLSLTNNMAIKDNYAVAIFSSERSDVKMTNRLLESETGRSLSQLQSENFSASEKDHVVSLLSTIAKAKIYIDDTPSLSVEDLYDRVAEIKTLQEIDLIIIDYLELITTGLTRHESRPEQLGHIVKKIRNLATEFNLPFLLFSQSAGHVNGSVSTDDPSPHTLPGFLKEHSDILMLLRRKDAYRAIKDTRNLHAVELLISNSKDPENKIMVPLSFIESIAKFTDFS